MCCSQIPFWMTFWWFKAQGQAWLFQCAHPLVLSKPFRLRQEPQSPSLHPITAICNQRFSDQNEENGDLFHEWTKMECFHFQWALSQVNISWSKLVLKLNYSYLLEHSRERLWSVCPFTKGVLAGWPPISSHSGWKRGYNNHLVWRWYWTDDIFWTILNE